MKPARLELHADLTRRAVVNSAALPWHASPCAQVERRMLERDGDEVARATSIVRYAPGARFDAHVHELGEEILVLEGRVLSTACQPVAGAIVDLWSCDAQGVYDNTGFKLRGHQITNALGWYRFETLMPGAYGNSSFRRTPHLHVKIQPPASSLLTTQLYFPDQPLNQRDGFFNPALLVKIEQKAKQPKRALFDFVVPVQARG